MSKFHCDETGVGNLDLNMQLQQAVNSLSSYVDDPEQLLTSSCDVFREALDVADQRIQSLR